MCLRGEERKHNVKTLTTANSKLEEFVTLLLYTYKSIHIYDFIYNMICVCVCICVQMHMGVCVCPLRAEVSVQSPGAGVIGAWELPDTDAGNESSALNC